MCVLVGPATERFVWTQAFVGGVASVISERLLCFAPSAGKEYWTTLWYRPCGYYGWEHHSTFTALQHGSHALWPCFTSQPCKHRKA